jgi:hypothetical protein
MRWIAEIKDLGSLEPTQEWVLHNDESWFSRCGINSTIIPPCYIGEEMWF